VRRVVRQEPALVLRAGPRLDDDRVVLRLDVDRLDLPGLELGDEVAVGRDGLGAVRRDELLDEERQDDNDEDGEGCALEEPAHEDLDRRLAP
jgi:hypothetical protein